MAIHAQTSCTLSTITDVEAVYTYYYLSDSTITVDEAPKDGVNAPGAQTITVISDGESYIWQLTEPELDIEDDIIQTAVGKLYYIECVKFSNETYDWGPLMTSSTYAAAKAAYNLSYQAIQQAQAANEATALLGGHFLYNSTWETLNTPHSANVVQTIVNNGIDVRRDPTKWEYNTHIGANGIRLRYNETVLSEWKTNSLTFFKPNTAYPALSLTGNAITFYNPSSNNAQLVIGANGTLQSGNYSRGSSPKFADDGTKIDLINGDIITKYFRISQGLEQGLTAGAYVYGTIEALDGTIGTDSTNYWEIGNSTDYNLYDTAKIIGHGSSYIQLGDSSTWRLATNRIHTGWYTASDSLLHYPQINSKYWDFGIHIPNSDNPSGRGNDKFLYIRSAKTDSTSLTNLLYDIDDNYSTAQWDYKFWIDDEGKVHAPGFYIGNSTTPIGGGAGTVAEKLLSGAGSVTQPVYFRSDSEIINGETVDHTGEVAAVSWDVKTILNNSNNEVPTSAAVKTFVENKGYLTSYTETDPSVPAWAKASTKPTYTAAEVGALATSLKGANNGVAELDNTGKVPAAQLPSYVDDVLEFTTYNNFPSTGESGKIYIAVDTNRTYRWSGSQYVEISSSLALGETHSSAYYGDWGAAAYDHATDSNKLTTTQNSGFYKFSVTSEGHIGSVTAVTANDIPILTKSKISDFPTTWALSNITGADDLKAIEALTGTNGLLRKTANNTWTLDTNTYLTSYTETDPIFTTSVAHSITTNDIENWNSKTSNTGTVTSVTLTQGTGITISNSGTAITTTGSRTISLADTYGDTKNPYGSKTARYVLAAPANAAGAPSFRALTNADVGLNNVLNEAQVTGIGSNNGKLRVYKGANYEDVTVEIVATESTTAVSASKLSSYGGANNKPIYIPSTGTNQGKPVAIDYEINKTVPSNAIFTDTTYSFSGGTNGFTVTPLGGTAQTVTVTPSISNNITGTGTRTDGYLVKFSGTNTITNGPALSSTGTGFLRQDGTWATPGGTYSLPIAKYDVLGGVKPWFSTTGASTLASGNTDAYSNSPSINERTTTAGKYYAVEIDKNGRLFVNVPWSDTTYTIPTQTNSSTTGITVNDHSTTTIYGVSSLTTSVTGVNGLTSVRGVKTDSTTTASKASSSGSNGSASNWTFESKTVTKNPSFTYNSSDTSLTISFETETIYSKSGGGNGTAPTWSFTDVTVPIMANSNTTVPIAATSATTVPIKNLSSITVVTSGTHIVNDSGHSHTI